MKALSRVLAWLGTGDTVTGQERDAEFLDAVQRIALALECINRQLFLIREMMIEARGEATDEEG